MMRNRKHRKTESRRAIAAVEFAVCLPMLLVILIGIIECCSMIYLKQSLSIAAYEGSRASVKSGATAAQVRSACNQILTARSVNGATIDISPNTFETDPATTWISVRVSATGGSNSVIAGWFYDALVVDGEATMMKEF